MSQDLAMALVLPPWRNAVDADSAHKTWQTEMQLADQLVWQLDLRCLHFLILSGSLLYTIAQHSYISQMSFLKLGSMS